MYFVSAIALFAGLAAAIHEPVGDPKGNAIRKPALAEIVPACKPYTITWDADTYNKISIRLLRGPSGDIKPLGAPLVEGIDNTGTYTWTPAADLEADTTHYGLQIIDDVNGQYQYSSQFGISKDASCVGGSSSSSMSAYPSATPNVTSSTPMVSSTPYVTPSASHTASTGFPHGNTTLVAPTGTLSVPSSLLTMPTGATATTTGPVQATGAAGHVQAGLGLAGAIAGLVMMI
jgi:hypothetical protein